MNFALKVDSVSKIVIKKGKGKNPEQHTQLHEKPVFSLFFRSQTMCYIWKWEHASDLQWAICFLESAGSFLSPYKQTKPENRKFVVINFHITIPETLKVKYTMFQNSFNYLGLFFCIQNVNSVFFPLPKQYLRCCSPLSLPPWSWSFKSQK